MDKSKISKFLIDIVNSFSYRLCSILFCVVHVANCKVPNCSEIYDCICQYKYLLK